MLSSIRSWSSSAAPISQRQLTSPGHCASSERSQPSARNACPARSAACAWRRFAAKPGGGDFARGAAMLCSLPRPRGFRLHSRTRPGPARQTLRDIVRLTRLQTAFALILGLTPLAALAGRPLEPADWYRFRAVSDLQIAPDGRAVAYLVTRYDRASDESRASCGSPTGMAATPRRARTGGAPASRASVPTGA